MTHTICTFITVLYIQTNAYKLDSLSQNLETSTKYCRGQKGSVHQYQHSSVDSTFFRTAVGPLSYWYQRLLPQEGKFCSSVKLITHVHLEQKLRRVKIYTYSHFTFSS